MTKYLNFEDLEIWKDSMTICKDVYLLLNNRNDLGLKNQICRSAISIQSNIAEGYERKGNKETIQ
ncbi:MAG: four helix bundle protein [Bacteroidales bacterium]|jgi:four helix bundle protein|nr:four helix bundle protein [Bacteroidales bacterium]